ncbi:MAG: preprotein translocase subunit SecA, partial [Candidatus Omnitrophica bacterium]|nr:preprotein translocase subunit SecA [Candidatus Omnitrophota bacterium]
DSILIYEARTPLIISGPAEESTDKYYTANKLAGQLKGRRITERQEIDAKYKGEDISKGYDYIADEKAQTIALTEEGEVKASRIWGIESLHDIETMEYRHHTIQALRAKEFFERDVDYVVKDGEVVIVDEFTGRMMPGRRWSDGLHQAVEAKEGMKIERENQTLATITFQNYFRMYEKLAGMTGTAYTEANEFKAIYKLDVVVLPTNRQLIRTNFHDCIYKSEKEKFKAVVEEIADLHAKGQPVLVGTISIDRSERLSEMLKMKGVQHQVLNAKYHEVEAQIVAQAGRYKAVTIATNMAGRGTDILLGGNPEFIAKNVAKQKLSAEDPHYQEEYKALLERFKKESQAEHEKVVQAGGLHVLGTERHEARRIDNQLRGRSGRQGDPGSSRFYVSLEDELMRLFGSDKLIGIMDKLGLEEGQVIEHPWVSRSIEIAQKRVETHNFEIRKQLLEYDNVMNKQREVIYGQRHSILEGTFSKEDIYQILEGVLDETLTRHTADSMVNIEPLASELKLRFGLDTQTVFKSSHKDQVREALLDFAKAAYEEKEKSIGAELLRHLEKIVFLQIIDARWKDHLYAMDTLREGNGLRAYGQRDPLVEYQREAFHMFQEMNFSIQQEAAETIFKIRPQKEEGFRGIFTSTPQELVHQEMSGFEAMPTGEAQPSMGSAVSPKEPPIQQAVSQKVGRNDPCPCGSGKKYKKCCGK